MTVELGDAGAVEGNLRGRVDQLASLTRLSDAVARAAGLEEAYDAALDCVAETLAPDRASVLLFDRDGVMRFKAWRGLSDAYRRATEGHTPWTPGTKDPQPVLVEDVAADPALAELRPAIEAEGIRALGFFPLVGRDRLLGKFMVYFEQPHRFTATEIELGRAIGAHVALEIGRRHAEDELRLHAALLQLQSDLAKEGILVLSSTGRIVSYNRAFADLWRLPPGAAAGRSDDTALPAMRRLLVDPESFFARASDLDTRSAEVSRDEIPLLDGRVLERHGARIAEPGGAVHGRVWFFKDVTERRRAEARAAFLAEASRILGQSLDYRSTLVSLAELVVGFLADACAVDVVVDGELRQVALATADPSRAPELAQTRERFRARAGDAAGARKVVETGEPLLYREIGEDDLRAAAPDPEQLELLRAIGPRSALIVPLHARGRTFGAITLIAGESGRRFDEADLELASDLARRAALAADNGLLHETEQRARDAAERLQAVTEALARGLTVGEIADALVREGAAALGAAAGWIAVVDEERSELRRVASLGYRPDLEQAYAVLPLALENPTVDAVLQERALWLESCQEVVDAYPALDADYRATGFEAMAIVPLSVGGRSTGVIALNFTRPRAFREDERRLLVALAAQCGQALERAQLYAALQERADAASVLAHVGDGVFQVDLTDRVTLWNRGAEVITGLAEEEVIGRRIDELFVGWKETRPRISITDVPVAFGRREALPLRIAGRDLSLAISGVASGDGVVYAFRDVTEAERLEQARRDFLATASHELRTPLAGVFGATKTLLRRTLDEPTTRKLLGVIDGESERLARILDELLYASRLDEGRLELDIGRCDAVSVAREVIELVRVRLPEGMTITLDAGGAIPEVACDPAKLRQVLLNLVDNAIKYSPGGGAITVSVLPRDRAVRLSVSDQGLGIATAEHELIFEKFYRLDPQLSRGVGGTGLGLYICRGFVERMNGRIWVRSAEGRGSTFHVELPAAG